MDGNRREALKWVGAAALTAGVAPLLGSCSGVVRASVQDGERDMADLSPILADILYHASLAPSGHNTQPWKVRVASPDRLLVGSAPDRWLPEVDPDNRELLLSIGCFLENLLVAAGHHGYAVDYRVIGESGSSTDVLDVSLRPATPRPVALDRMRLRRTVRRGHLRRALSSADVAALASSLGDQHAYFPADVAAGRWLAERTIEANRVQADRDGAQAELARWIRWRDANARQHRNGLTPEAMEIQGIAGWYVRHFMDESSVMKPSFRERSVDTVRGHLTSYGGWLIITSPDASPTSLIETGRRVERMWLGVRDHMIAIHPMTQVLEESPFRDEVATHVGVSGPVQFILRVGYLDRYPDPVSLRMPISRFVTVG